MLAYLKRNPLGNSALIAIFTATLLYSFIGVSAEYSGLNYSDAGLLAGIFIYPIILPVSAFVMFMTNRYLKKDSLAGESIPHNYRPTERIILGLTGLIIILIRYLALTYVIPHSYSDWSGLA